MICNTYNPRDLPLNTSYPRLVDIEALIIVGDTVYINDWHLKRPIVVDGWMRKATKYGAIDSRTDYRAVCHGLVDEDTAMYGDI